MTDLATPPPSPHPVGDGPIAAAGHPHATVSAVADGWEVTARGPDGRLELSDLLPVTEAFGFRIVEATARHDEGITTHLLRIRSEHMAGDATAARLQDGIAAALAGTTVVDRLLGLLSTTTLTWVEVDWLRAARKMLDLLGASWSGDGIDGALLANPDAAWALVSLFRSRHDPDVDPTAEATAFHALDAIRSGIVDLTHDRIVGDLTDVLRAVTRTNAFAPTRTVDVADGTSVPMLACKFDSAALPTHTAPVPFAEILVTSPRTTGVHLRAGAIARGGLRASDRTDVRDEVLDLMAAQVVKNSMIVPTGAKGGFVAHDVPGAAADRATRTADAYRIFVEGLLSVTDDVVADGAGGDVVGPAGIRRRDGDDPYLVVAADKGTARLSDTANAIADAHGFWLGDAFASGGSSGWDHKELGVTAKGAWTAIARHFRELGIDVHTDPVRVVGIGDMSGDVFGNGLLTSRSLRLVAAFDHRDIFLDPDPDPAASFDERRRLFDLPTSSWQDWDRDVLSPGGLVASRSTKSVALTPEVRDLLGVTDSALPPDALIRAILRTKVDLLYAGGIGTVVRATGESFTGDRTNDDIRIEASELAARVVGEGANLAVTPRGRIEYARRGGRIDQDAIHNAGGVATSDREVNAKILFAPAVRSGRLDRTERDAVLHAAADEVVADVCRDVDAQVWLLSRAHARSARDLAAHARHLDRLVDAGLVDRLDDLLPGPDELSARADAGAGLTRPELATVMAATKRACTAALADHPLLATETALPALAGAFATPIRTHPAVDVRRHRLADEITALRIASQTVDRFGITHLHDLADLLRRPVGDVLAAHWQAQQVLRGDDWWPALQACAGTVPDDTLEDVTRRLVGLQADLARRLVRAGFPDDVDAVVARHRTIADLVRDGWRDRRRGTVARRRIALLDDLVPDELALEAAIAADLGRVPQLAVVLSEVDADTVSTGLAALRRVADRLGLVALDAAIERHLGADAEPAPAWRHAHGERLRVDLDRVHLDLTRRVLDPTASEVGLGDVRSHVETALRAVRDEPACASDALASVVGDLRDLVATP